MTTTRRLELFTGPMFSGKTDALVDTYSALAAQGRSVVALKPALDTRHADDVILSRSGRSIPGSSVPDEHAVARLGREHGCVLVDEAQFFPAGLAAVLAALADEGRTVVAAGLDLDFARRPFETTSLLALAASTLVPLASVCTLCGAPAPYTQRLVAGVPAGLDEPALRVGDVELYEPRCGACWDAERRVPAAASGATPTLRGRDVGRSTHSEPS